MRPLPQLNLEKKHDQKTTCDLLAGIGIIHRKSQVYVEGYNINADTTIQYVEMVYITSALSMYTPNPTGTITGFLLFERANTAPAR